MSSYYGLKPLTPAGEPELPNILDLAPFERAQVDAMILARQPAPPPIPTLTKLIAPNAEDRGDGAINKSLVDTEVRGFEQNITIKAPGYYLLTNVRTFEAWREKTEDANVGQGLYLDGNTDADISGFYAARNGWQAGKGLKAKNDKRHGLYANEGGTLVLEDFIVTENASCGLQLRRASKIRRGFIHRNSIGILAVMQPCEIEDVVIYGASAGVPTGANNWVGWCGLDLYSPVTLRNVWIVGDGDMSAPGTLQPPTSKPYASGAVKCSRKHPQFPNTGGGSVQVPANDCVIAGWPGETGSNKLFSGDRPHDGSGFRIVNHVVSADAEVRTILREVEENRAPSIAEASKRLRELVRAKVA